MPSSSPSQSQSERTFTVQEVSSIIDKLQSQQSRIIEEMVGRSLLVVLANLSCSKKYPLATETMLKDIESMPSDVRKIFDSILLQTETLYQSIEVETQNQRRNPASVGIA